jgi:putative RecB family exonuclease
MQVIAQQPATALGEVLSQSQVRTFTECSARWMFKYSWELPDPPTPALTLGEAFHAAMEANFRQKIETRKDLPVAEVAQAYRRAFAERAGETQFGADDPATVEAKGAELVALYMREAAPRIQPRAVEVEVEGKIAGVRVRGRIDLVDWAGRIVEFKTSSRKPSGITSQNAFQLATYARLVEGATGETRVDTLVKTKLPQLVQIGHQVNGQDYLATERLYPLAQAAMREGFYYPNRNSVLCSRRNCPFWSACEDEFGGRVEAV